jgi:hypothetical protein
VVCLNYITLFSQTFGVPSTFPPCKGILPLHAGRLFKQPSICMSTDSLSDIDGTALTRLGTFPFPPPHFTSTHRAFLSERNSALFATRCVQIDDASMSMQIRKMMSLQVIIGTLQCLAVTLFDTQPCCTTMSVRYLSSHMVSCQCSAPCSRARSASRQHHNSARPGSLNKVLFSCVYFLMYVCAICREHTLHPLLPQVRK